MNSLITSALFAHFVAAFKDGPCGRTHLELELVLTKLVGNAADLLVDVAARLLRATDAAHELVDLEVDLLRVLEHVQRELLRHCSWPAAAPVLR